MAKDEDMDRNGDNDECHNVPLQKDLVSSTRKKQIFVDLEDDDDDDDDDDDEDVQKADMDTIDEDIDRNGGNNEYHNAFLQKDLVISTRKKRIFVDLEDDDDDDDNESNSQHEDIEKIDLQNLKVEKNDDDNNFNRYQNEDALQTMDDNKNGNYYYGLNDNNSTPLIYTARKGLRKHIFSSPENDNQSMEKENLQNENSSKSTQINDNSSPLSVNGVRHTSEKKVDVLKLHVYANH